MDYNWDIEGNKSPVSNQESATSHGPSKYSTMLGITEKSQPPSLGPRPGLPFDRQPGRQDAGHGHSGPDGDGRTRRLFRGGGERWGRERLDAGGSL